MRAWLHPATARSSRLAVDETLSTVQARLGASATGLETSEAQKRLVQYGPNRLREVKGNHPVAVLVRQFRSPMVLILLGAALLSAFLNEVDEAAIVAIIVLASTGLGFVQEYRAGNALAELRRRVAVTSLVRRDGHEVEVPTAEIVPGEIVLLRAGSLIPADGLILEASALHVDEAVLTGESFPVVKMGSTLDQRLTADNRIHMGTSVRSGEGVALITETGLHTEYGSIAASVTAVEPETSLLWARAALAY